MKTREPIQPDKHVDVLYRKVGRRYKPVGLEELPYYYKPGYYLVRVEAGCTSTMHNVDPAFAEVEHALRAFEDVLCQELVQATKARAPRNLTALELEGLAAFKKICGSGSFSLERDSCAEMARRAVDKFRTKFLLG